MNRRCYVGGSHSLIQKLERASSKCPSVLQPITNSTHPAQCYCPLQTTVTKYASSNCTITPSSASGTLTGTETTGAKPTCSLTGFPERFYIKDSESGWLATDSRFNRLFGVLSKPNATVFHIAWTDDGQARGIPQLAFNKGRSSSNSTPEYRAAVRNRGGPIRFFNSSFIPGDGNSYRIVTPSFSSYLCQMTLSAWMNHDLSYSSNCGGALWLDGGEPDDGCIRVELTVSPA